jgi:hypothetical protein
VEERRSRPAELRHCLAQTIRLHVAGEAQQMPGILKPEPAAGFRQRFLQRKVKADVDDDDWGLGAAAH